ncbi:alpha/beta-hydrolase, partial [Aureobasidium melanogenum]
MADYAQIPSTAKVQPKPFKVEIDANDIQSMKHLIAHSKIGPATYENQQTDRRFGMNRDWLIKAKKHWETNYDWRRCENHMNSFPNFTIPVTDPDGSEFTIHFLALFSTSPTAIPIAFFHGWPGSILEFLSMLDLIKKQYSDPSSLPYHIIVPSLPGYAFSSAPPLDRDFKNEHIAPVMDAVMQALGFGDGYIAQGGDLGSFISRQLGVESASCKAFHQNLFNLPPPANADSLPISEMFASQSGPSSTPRFAKQSSKPQGYSYFPKELYPTPVSWVKECGNFVHVASHERGGHFAAMERPEDLWGDVEAFVERACVKKDGASKI